ncbi:hypothetical protein E6P45_12265 [Salmonella enterica]|nr:hypothetical protein [Salmonella enterica]ECH8775157.1 hypothetical protein [Salmonella enterica subsp. houtenae]EAV2690647.1 hypothetical protein [Salmonella enterica]EAV5572116.1 hypothetical protein [Salmonella enterica]ECT8363399.1 hypothetical protein [Salmonella enterica]
MKQSPLSGVIIVSIEHVIAAPCCTRQLADYFSRVTIIECQGNRDFFCNYDERLKNDLCIFFFI